MSVEIWHNPRCSKSRQTLALLEQNNIAAQVVRYLETPPTRAQLVRAHHLLNLPVLSMIRSKDPLFRTLGLSKTSSDKILLHALENNPSLIERPIVLTENGAAIGRPPEAILPLLDLPLPHS